MSSTPAEPAPRVAFLGPAGTFTEAALDGALAERGVAAVERVPMATVGHEFYGKTVKKAPAPAA